MTNWDEFSIWLTQPEQGYKFPLRVDNKRYAALAERFTGWSIVIGDIGDRFSFNEEYSYPSTDAVLALILWASEEFEGQPKGWVRHTARGKPTERRPKQEKDGRFYTCSACGRRCLTAWSEEEAIAEARAAFGDYITADNIYEFCEPICDTCHKEFLKWRAELSVEEEERLRRLSEEDSKR